MITLKELASIAGVSVSTVSKALNNADDVSTETKNAIVQLARKHGYIKNVPVGRTATAEITGPRIALIYSDVISHYYSTLIQRFDQRIARENGIMLACDSQFSTGRTVELCKFFEESGQVDGIICVSALCDLGDLPVGNIPITGISYYPNFESHPFDYICVNDGMGIEEAVRCLKDYGHSAIAYLGEPYTKQRQIAFENAMKKFDLQVDSRLVHISDRRFQDAGYESMQKILQQDQRPTAIVCAYDDVALGASKAIFEAGYQIPEDFSILGVDNTMQTIYNYKTLASVNCHIEEQVDIILAMLNRKIKEPSYRAVQNISLQTDFIARETVAPLRARNGK